MSEKERKYRVSYTGQDWHGPGCYGCGTENDHGLHADFRFYEPAGEVRFQYTPRKFQEGAPGYMHGGIIASLLDEAQGVLCFHLGHLVMTDQLNVSYEHAISLENEISIRCWVTSVRKRRIYTNAAISDASGAILANSSGRWYILHERIARRLFQHRYSEKNYEELREMLDGNRKRAKEIRARLREEKEESGDLLV